ncbi:hypothetical protein AMES_1758 [Amycolatopsis mediterranei S699]|uniref:Secreted protein n=2 Tax=Amycolatopsis mediterranei TaxID=33910 RepID=A0A0H3CY56_AMYMU|nr:hypothetical protein [Amycolatopsis mediterranei]ADJ43582.1 conserved hypothetical protein [Amycolatopsis mediterranei U32]AEK40288.1 hypothetical protein RAM_08990 [Amycolatopsis mediterranei S699]AFO75294.1 hypothetical protein AMES_1758 [Amycolatopsis mediterranei S699]AGT82423.1 hypothetical protein B737_1759 [Amycolatopsis mediterranei RB]KDO03781.1 hypothetical protein DV26_47245 [Amycolatopsis mediterranei]
MSVATQLKRLAVLTSAAAVVLGGVAVTPASADVIQIPVSYKVTGSTTVKKTGSAMTLGPGTLKGNLIIDDQTGSVGLSADLALPPAQANISLVAGLFRIKATVKVVPLGPSTGTLADGTLTAHAKSNMEISDIYFGILSEPTIPLPTLPGACKTKTPIEMDLVAPNIDITSPTITLSSTYTIPEFNNCFLADIALGALVSGPGNTISLDLTSDVS